MVNIWCKNTMVWVNYMDNLWVIYGKYVVNIWIIYGSYLDVVDINMYYLLVSLNMAGWKIPELNGGFYRKITYKWSIFQQAMFDYRRVLAMVNRSSCGFHKWCYPKMVGL